jgi:Tol biopolymer transport system component
MIPGAAFRRPLLPLIALLLSASLVVSACGQPDPDLSTSVSPAGADPSGRILFVAGDDVRLWDDGDVEQVTKDEDFEALSPSWAPDGQRFAYVRKSEGFSDLIVANLNGELLKQVTFNEPGDEPHSEDWAFNAAWAFDPVWSHAGEQLIFVSDKGGLDPMSDPLYLWYSETWDAEPYPLPAAVDLDVFQENPTLSPDGDSVAFVARQRLTDSLRNTQVWTIDLNTAETRVLVDHADGAYDPAWSPDDRNVAYIQRDGTRNDVWIAPIAGGDAYRLTDIGTCVSPVWSPDGRFLAFFRENDGHFEAWYVEVEDDGNSHLTASEPQRLFTADNISTISGMSWAPD